MLAVDVCRLPTTGGSAFALVAGLFLLVFGVIVARWVRQSSGRLSIVMAPLVLLGGLALTPSAIDPCVSPPITTTVPSASTSVPSATTTTSTTPQYELLENATWGTGSEGDSIQEFAPEGKIFTEVLFASYGTPTGADGQFQQGACHAENSHQIVADEFIGNSEGNLTFDSSTFGNPCGDTDKTFAIVLAYGDDPTPTTTTTTTTEVPTTTTTTTEVPSATTSVPSVTTTTTTTTTSTTTTTLAPVALYQVGQDGPSGGKIFYVDMNRAEGSRYFEMACAGWSDGICGGSSLSDPRLTWGCRNSSISTGTAIGTGEANTIAIVAGCSTTIIAARKASLLVLGGYDDWFLPSKSELNQMCLNRGVLGLTSFDFLSSSQQSSTHAWAQYAANPCGSYTANKATETLVRPVRSF